MIEEPGVEDMHFSEVESEVGTESIDSEHSGMMEEVEEIVYPIDLKRAALPFKNYQRYFTLEEDRGSSIKVACLLCSPVKILSTSRHSSSNLRRHIAICHPVVLPTIKYVYQREKKEISQNQNRKRSNYLSWNDFFMASAFLAAKRNNSVSEYGACIVNQDKRIVGTGCTSVPLECFADELQSEEETGDLEENKNLYVCHAEMNAILNRNSADVKNCTMYVGAFPCNQCAKSIIESGIKEVIYLSSTNSHTSESATAQHMFASAGVKYWRYVPQQRQIAIDFDLP